MSLCKKNSLRFKRLIKDGRPANSTVFSDVLQNSKYSEVSSSGDEQTTNDQD